MLDTGNWLAKVCVKLVSLLVSTYILLPCRLERTGDCDTEQNYNLAVYEKWMQLSGYLWLPSLELLFVVSSKYLFNIESETCMAEGN